MTGDVRGRHYGVLPRGALLFACTPGHCWKRSSDFFLLSFSSSSLLSLSLCSSRTSYPLCEFLPPPLCSLLLPGSFEAERDADRITLGPCFHSLLWLAININGDVSGWRKKETSCWEAWMTSVYETAPSYRESATTVRLSCRTKIHGAFR